MIPAKPLTSLSTLGYAQTPFEKLGLSPVQDPRGTVQHALDLLEQLMTGEDGTIEDVEAFHAAGILVQTNPKADADIVTALLLTPFTAAQPAQIMSDFSPRIAQIMLDTNDVLVAANESPATAAAMLKESADLPVHQSVMAVMAARLEFIMAGHGSKGLHDAITLNLPNEDGNFEPKTLHLVHVLADFKSTAQTVASPSLGMTDEPALEARFERALCAVGYKLNPPQRGFGQQMMFDYGGRQLPHAASLTVKGVKL